MDIARTREQNNAALTVEWLYPLVKQIDKAQAEEIRRRSPERVSDVVFRIISYLGAAFVGLVVLLFGLKSVLNTNDASFWNPVGSALLVVMIGLFLAWSAWIVIDMVSSIVRFYRNHLRDIDQALSRDEVVSTQLHLRIRDFINGSNSPLPQHELVRLQAIVRHLRTDVGIRTVRANLGAILGALASVLMATYDALQKSVAVAYLPEIPAYAGAMAIGVLLGAALLMRFTGRLSRLQELLERVLLLERPDNRQS